MIRCDVCYLRGVRCEVVQLDTRLPVLGRLFLWCSKTTRAKTINEFPVASANGKHAVERVVDDCVTFGKLRGVTIRKQRNPTYGIFAAERSA
jgi:hypothetical protein